MLRYAQTFNISKVKQICKYKHCYKKDNRIYHEPIKRKYAWSQMTLPQFENHDFKWFLDLKSNEKCSI